MTEEERLALWMQAQRNAGVENPQQFAEYTGEADPGLENVHPELLLGGAGTLAARGVMKGAPALWKLGNKAIKHIDPVTGNRVVRPGIQKALAGIRNSIVRPGHAGGTRGPINRGVNASGKPTISRGPTSTPYGPRVGPLGYALGAGGAAYIGGGGEEPALEETVEVFTTKPEESKKKEGKKWNPKPGNETKENDPNLWKTWGSLADNPKERKKAYLSSIKNIYMKKMMLDGMAKLTGGTSQGNTWAQMAIAELDAIEKFDSEERVHQQWKSLFFNEDGTYNPPKNREQAMKRGQEMGFSADQMKDILSVFPKDTSKDKGGVVTEQYDIWLAMPEGTEEEIELKRVYGNMINVNRGEYKEKIKPYQAANLLGNAALNLTDEQIAALTAIMDTGIGIATTGGASTESEKPVTVSTQAEYDALASGTLYVDGSGEQKRKP